MALCLIYYCRAADFKRGSWLEIFRALKSGSSELSTSNRGETLVSRVSVLYNGGRVEGDLVISV